MLPRVPYTTETPTRKEEEKEKKEEIRRREQMKVKTSSTRRERVLESEILSLVTKIFLRDSK